jgi:hypothetical protein
MACVAAGVLVIAGIILGLPVLAALGVLMCGAMTVGMVWMMFSMARRTR